MDFEDLEKKVREIQSLVSKFSVGKVEQVMKDKVTKLDDRSIEDITKLTDNMCYHRPDCDALGIDYCEISDEDYNKAFVCAYYLYLEAIKVLPL